MNDTPIKLLIRIALIYITGITKAEESSIEIAELSTAARAMEYCTRLTV